MGRAPCCDKVKVKRGAWSPEEDASLITYLQKHGTGGNWISLPRKAGLNRCGKSCRLRWLNYLRPDIKHGGFSEEEDNIIYNLYSTIGSRWSFIASQLPGRTDNDVKNYWNTKLKKKLVWKSTNTQDDHAINLAQSSSASLIPEIEISNINIIQGNYGNNSSACIDIVDANSKQQLLHLCHMHAIESKLEPTTATTQTQFGCSNDDHKELISRSTSTTSTNISSSVSQRASNLSTSSTTSQGLELETNNLGSCNWRYGTGSTCSEINNEDGIDNMVDYLGFDSSITTHHHLLLNGFGFGF